MKKRAGCCLASGQWNRLLPLGRLRRLREVGPRDGFLIRIAHCIQNPEQLRLWPSYPALPELDYPPARRKQCLLVPGIASDVLVKFALPEFLAGSGSRGIATSGVPVPEAAMHEDADPVTGEHQIRPSRKVFLVKTISEAVPMQQTPDLHFR